MLAASSRAKHPDNTFAAGNPCRVIRRVQQMNSPIVGVLPGPSRLLLSMASGKAEWSR